MKKNKHSKHDFSDLFLDGCDYDNWFIKPNDKDFIELLLMSSLEDDDEVKEGKSKNLNFKLK